MISEFTKIIRLVLAAIIVLAGCRQEYKEGVDVLACGPDFEVMPVPADYASSSIVAAGGLQEWARERKLELDGVVALPQGDGSVYLTEWRCDIYPWSNSIRISSFEPQGEFVCELSNGGFRVLTGTQVIEGLASQIGVRDLADAILAVTTASVRFLDTSSRFTRASEPVRVQGLWYYPIERTYVGQQTPSGGKVRETGQSGPYWSQVVFYQNRDNWLVDIIRLADVDEQKFFSVRGYDYARVQKKGILVPAKIEIFRSDARRGLLRRVAQVSFQ